VTERGKLYVIEGGDGSGKATQAEKTREYATSLGKNVLKRSFPRYGEPSASVVERYLNGEFGDVNSVPAEFAAYAFAVDRLAGTAEIRTHIEQGDDHIAILDRYRASNLAHQGAKIRDLQKRRDFYVWGERMETEDLGMLEPDHTVVLLVPPEISHENVANKDKRDYTDKTHDIHEADMDYQGRVKLAYEELCALFPDRYVPIECTDMDGHMRTREAIQLDIRTALGL